MMVLRLGAPQVSLYRSSRLLKNWVE
jgi:hypothetical protein